MQTLEIRPNAALVPASVRKMKPESNGKRSDVYTSCGFSPLKPINGYLRFARFTGGFPLVATDPECSQWETSAAAWIGIVLVFTMCCLLLPVGVAMVHAHGKSVGDFFVMVI